LYVAEPCLELLLRERPRQPKATAHADLGAAKVRLERVCGTACRLIPAGGIGEGIGQSELKKVRRLGQALAPVGLELEPLEVEQNPWRGLLDEHR
jgi:hypothetical protein